MVNKKTTDSFLGSVRDEGSLLEHFFRNYNYGQMCSDIIYDVESDKILHLSEDFQKLTGHECDNYPKQCLLFIKTLIHPDDYNRVLVSLIEFVKLGRAKPKLNHDDSIRSFAFRIKDSNQEWVLINLHVLMLLSNKTVGIIQKQKILTEDEPASVSAREKEILNLIADGNSAKIIGDKLNISPNTVITHKNNLKKKFRVKNTAELIKEAFRSHLI